MRKLFRIDTGVTYWVVSTTPEEAMKLIVANELDSGYSDDELSSDADTMELSRESCAESEFRIDGEPETCSMWLAYMILRDSASAILACSEW
jgi:hypothetical protein